MSTLRPFHLATPVNDLAAARHFYGSVLACPEGRSSDRWIDFDFWGHQFVVHLDEAYAPQHSYNGVDAHRIPSPHFGVVLEWSDWEGLVDRLRANGVDFVVEPGVRFPGQPGEQGTFFVKDPSGNVLEFKTFRDLGMLFAG